MNGLKPKKARLNAARRKQKAYEAHRRAWRESHPLVEARGWEPPYGHPRYGEVRDKAEPPT
jgi:hypothetical protein